MASSESLACPKPVLDSANADRRMCGLVSKHYDFVWRVLRRLGVPEALAEDAAQDVFIIVDRKTREFWPQNEKSYLFAVALRVAAEERRSARHPTEHLSSEDWAAIADASPEPDILLDDQRARDAVDRILELIPIEQRIVFILFELEDLTMQEISEVLAVPSGTVASRLRRAREVFRQAAQRANARAVRGGAR